ncbi:DEAD/DEAH box helicase [Enterobacter cloacae]|uniref:DEAD/DEAH box helicase n=1 Tax=Enterobacter cloacae TaxID=550 RepID=UPI001D0C9A1A|nr:DEAD/DEAH box helicase family protein [Enterobacter cloacae]
MQQSINVVLPEVRLKKIQIGGNGVYQIHFPQTTAVLTLISNESGVNTFKSNLPFPLDTLILTTDKRPPNLKDKYHLLFDSSQQPSELNEYSILKWANFISPVQMEGGIKSWKGNFRFIEEDVESNVKGLRKPQSGAIHAVSAYLYGEQPYEPVTVVLPTGTGKTETMLSLFFCHRLERLLVLVPSDALRKQISEKFITMGCLPEFGITPLWNSYPRVAVIRQGIKENECDELLKNCDVILATPNILNASSKIAIDKLCNASSALFIDEAHHISAKSWGNVREKFSGKPVVQFTATPFRNDGKNLGGRVIFNYTMGSAQRDGYFKNINLHAIEEYLESDKDERIAYEAIQILRRDLKSGNDHLMMARTNSQARAIELYSIYYNLAKDLNPVVIHSKMGRPEIRKNLASLENRESRLVICVDMLGEGFDLPNLKIAAIHDHHKSLAITLQFIGRFTRSDRKNRCGDATVIVNIADPGVEKGLINLYSQGADWDSVLRRLSEDRISKEIHLQELVDKLKTKGNLHKEISLWNLRPSFSAMLYKTNENKWYPEKILSSLPKFEHIWHSLSEDNSILVILGVRATSVKWGDFKDLNDLNHLLLIAHFNPERKAITFFSNDYGCFRVEKLIENLTDDNPYLVSGSKVFQVLNGVEYPLVLNLGSATTGAISFTQFFGPNVTEGLSSVEKSNSTLSNIAILGYENGNKILWGCSQRKGKIWSPRAGSILDWLEWVDNAWEKINQEDVDEVNITKDFLRPILRTEIYNEHPVSVQWGEYLQSIYEDNVIVSFGQKEYALYEVDLKVTKEEGNILIHLITMNKQSTYRLLIGKDYQGGYEYELISGEEIKFIYGASKELWLKEMMVNDPLVIHYIDGSFSYNCYLVKVTENQNYFDADEMKALNWNINIRKESMGRTRDPQTIQYKTWQEISNNYDIIINDDENGEAADLVCLKEFDDFILLSLYHCKYSSENIPGARIKDMYEVCGQAQRSIRWKHTGFPYLFRHIKKREELWRKTGNSRFLSGNLSRLQYFRDISRTKQVKFKVTIVQPGISKKQVSEEMLRLLGCTSTFIKKTTLADLNVWVSH